MSQPIGPLLGVLASPRHAGQHDDIRLSLVDDLVAENASGTLDGAVWLARWEAAVAALRDRILEIAKLQLLAAARRSKFPSRKLAALQPDDLQREALLNRLLAEGELLERLETGGWDSQLQRQRASALQEAWKRVVAQSQTEAMVWKRRARDVAEWRRPWTPLVVIASILIPVAIVVAAWLGGLVAAPDWFGPAAVWFWDLPWQ